MMITPFESIYVPQAADLFIQNFQHQLAATPILSDVRMDLGRASSSISQLFNRCQGFAAVDGDRLVGYIGWLIVDGFRNTPRKGAYIPEWGHSALPEQSSHIYSLLYRAASTLWAAEGCQVHAITLLASDHSARQAWFWNGFGLAVVDAIRPMQALGIEISTPLVIRKAVTTDASALAELDIEHCQHYTQPPIFMASPRPQDERSFCTFLASSRNSVWTAWQDDRLAGFLRFDGHNFDGVEVLSSENGVCITGAYVRSPYRGQKAAPAMLDAALRDYASQGFTYCAVDFESFNPEAAAFWLRYFEPVCLSLMRMPET